MWIHLNLPIINEQNVKIKLKLADHLADVVYRQGNMKDQYGQTAEERLETMDEVIIKGRDIIQYLKLKREGYRTAWVGEGLICMVKPKKS